MARVFHWTLSIGFVKYVSVFTHVQFSCIEIGKLLGFPSNLIFQIHQIHLCAHASHSRVWRGLEMRNKTIPLKWIHKRLDNSVLIINKMWDFWLCMILIEKCFICSQIDSLKNTNFIAASKLVTSPPTVSYILILPYSINTYTFCTSI